MVIAVDFLFLTVLEFFWPASNIDFAADFDQNRYRVVCDRPKDMMTADRFLTAVRQSCRRHTAIKEAFNSCTEVQTPRMLYNISRTRLPGQEALVTQDYT